MAELAFRVETLYALTHRGEYRVHVLREEPGAWATFHGFDGSCVTVDPPIIGAVGEVKAACAEHAARQPAHPPMLGWPACGEVSPC